MHENTDFRKKLISLVLPIAFAQFMLSLVSASDAFMLGKVSQSALAAVSLAGQVQFVLSLFTAAFTIGASMYAAQYWGKGDRDSVEKIFAMTLRVSALVGFVFTVVVLAVPSVFMEILTNDREMILLGSQYLRMVSPSYFLCALSQIYLCIMKNSGQTRLSTEISSLAVILNIALNAILIFGFFGLPAMGVRGAALATVLTRLVEIFLVVWNSLRRESIHLRFRYILHVDKTLWNPLVRRTLPVLGNELVWGIGFSMYTVILGRLGEDAVAANSIAAVVNNLMCCFCIGLGTGGSIMVGNELGAGNLEKGRAYGARLTKISIVLGAVCGGIILLLIPAVLSVTSLTEAADRYLIGMLSLSSVYMIGKSVNCTTISGIFCAGGDSRFGLLCDAVTLWVITVPAGFLAAFVFHLPVLVVYGIVNLDEMLKLPAVYHHYRKYHWVKNLTV